MEYYRIADLNIGIDCPDSLLSDKLDEFRTANISEPDITWRIEDDIEEIELPVQNWIGFSGFSVCNEKDNTYVRYEMVSVYQVGLIIYKNRYSKATYYLRDHDWRSKSIKEQQKLAEYLFSFFREAFFLALLAWNGVSLHSASIIYRDCGVAFAARSQTGKTIHTNLWKQRYMTPILDDEVTAIRIIDNQIYCYRLPWTESSNLSMNHRVKLRAVVFLVPSSKNKVCMMKPYEVVQSLYEGSFTASWLPELVKQQFAIIIRIQKRLQQAYLLECLPEPEAVETMKAVLDDNWNYIEWRK